MQGLVGFDAYMASASMYEVHNFMDLNHAKNTYFIQQVGMAAVFFGVANDDVKAVGKSLITFFNVLYAPPAIVIPVQGEQLQFIYIDEESCPLSDDAICSAYYEEQDIIPSNATMTSRLACLSHGDHRVRLCPDGKCCC